MGPGMWAPPRTDAVAFTDRVRSRRATVVAVALLTIIALVQTPAAGRVSVVTAFPDTSGSSDPQMDFSKRKVGDVWFGGDDGHGHAVPGGVWDWDTVGGDPLQGWRSWDMTANRITYFGRHTASDFQQHGDSCQPVLAGTASLWCGIHQDEAASIGFVSGMGYGNIQNQRAYSPPLAVNTPMDAVDISFIYFQDSEPQYDYTFVQLLCFDAAGAPVDTIPIAAFDGLAGTPATPILFDQGIEVPSGTLPPTTATVKLSFRFVSDMLVSDEDGMHATSCGPFGADNVSIRVGSTDHYYDFEADAGGWTFDTGSAVGSYMGVAAQGVWQDWLSAVGIAICSLSGNALEMVDQAGSPYSPPGHPDDQYEYAISGVIARGSFPGSAAHVTWSQYADMPGEQTTVYGVDYMYYPYTTPTNPTPRWSPLGSGLNSSFYMTATPTCGDLVLNLTMPATWDSMRITYCLYNYCGNPGMDPCPHSGDTHGSPVIDNVRVGFFLPLVGGTVYPINGVENSPASFASLTSAIARIRAAGVTGSGQVILELSPGYLGEPGPVWIPPIPGLPSTGGLTIRPSLGYTAVSSVAGASDKPYAIYITGNRVTLDGRAGGVGAGRDWTIRCTGSGANGYGQSAVRVSGTSNPLTNVVVRNCVLEAEAANGTSAILALTGNATYAVTNVTFEGNLVRSTGGEATNCRGYAVDVSGATKSTNSGLIIRNNVVNQFAYGGISLGSAFFPGAQIYGNDIFHMAAVTQPSATTLFGIGFNSATMAGAVIRNNFVHDIQLANGSSWVSGLYLASGNSSGNRVRIYNNRVSIGAGIQSTELPIYGIYEATGTGAALFDLDYNSIYVGGALGSGSTNSAAFYNAATANAMLNVRNNIFCNARSNSGTATGTHWGIATAGSACLAVLSHNDYYAGGIGGVLGTMDGSTSGNRSTLEQWRAAVPGDAQSVSQNPHYLAPTATPPVLTIDPAVPTQLESGGTAVSGIDTDFEGDIRQGSAGYGGVGYAPDIGADEFSGVTAQGGACCAPAGTCTVTTQANCAAPNTWQGAATTCTPNLCPQPTGACCHPDGSCTVTLATQCTGPWTMVGTCVPNGCTQPTGSCCYPNGTCDVTLAANCIGTWTMFGVCEPNFCPPETGACCTTNGSCQVTTQVACTGSWAWDGVCSPNICPQPGQGPNTGGVLLVHDTGIAFTYSQTAYPSTPPASCTEVDVEAPLESVYTNRRVWKVYAAFPPETSPRLKTVSWGITMTSEQNGEVAVLGGGLPNPETDSAVEQSEWPSESGSGIVETLGSAQTTSVVELYWFGGFGYGGPYVAAQVFAAAPHPTEETYFADDAVPENRNPILAFGTLGFGVPGSSPCPGAPGSCCRADSTCAMTTEATCSGAWILNGVCGPDPCLQATGACCDPVGSCNVTAEADCADTWSVGLACSPNPCPVPTGSCCYVDRSCAVLTQAECVGTWALGGECDPNRCVRNGFPLTQNLGNPIVLSTYGYACGSIPWDFVTEGWAMRRFSPYSEAGLDGPLSISSVEWGVRRCVAVDPAVNMALHVKVLLYSIPSGADMLFANFTPIDSAEVLVTTADNPIPPALGVWKNTPFAATFNPTGGTVDLVVAIHWPSTMPMEPDTLGDGRFQVSADNVGQTAEPYYAFADCGYPEPTTPTQLAGQPSASQLVLIVNGEQQGSCCTADGDCTVTTSAACAETWSVGLACTPNPCPQPTGACCNAFGTCLVTTESDCPGTWAGYIPCIPNVCPQPAYGPNGGGVLLVHDTGVAYTATQAEYPTTPPVDCAAFDNEAPLNLYVSTVWKVYAAFPADASPRLKSVTWGISRTSGGQGSVIVRAGGLPHPGLDSGVGSAGWPSGTECGMVEQLGVVDTAPVIELYWFAGYGYSEPETIPQTFATRPHPEMASEESVFGDDGSPQRTDRILAFGTLGFGAAGWSPCPGTPGACCDGEGSCMATTQALCSGVWTLNGACQPNPCSQSPIGACCSPAGDCAISTVVGCEGTWILNGVCGPNPCSPLYGGAIVAFGANEYGQCAVPLPNTHFISADGGGRHSLGLRDDHTIVAWGSNVDGQCNVPEPNEGFAAISAGYNHSLALRSDGSIAAWGIDLDSASTVPVPNTGFTAIAAGTYHNLALRADSSIVAWGQCTEAGECEVPSPNAGFVAISAGDQNSVGLKADGSIVAWGIEKAITGLPQPNTGFVAISSGLFHSLALRADGSIAAWGTNAYGQCDVPEPNSGFVAIAAGAAHSLGLKADGSIVGWGWNEDGRCDAPLTSRGYRAVAAGGIHSLGILASPAPPPAPTNLAASVIGRVKVRFSWECPGCNADGYVIERRPGSSLVWGSQGAVDAQSFAYNDVVPNTGLAWWYRVRSYNEGGMSPYPDPVCTYVGTLAVSIASHNLQPTLPRVRVGEKFLATFGLSNRELDSVAVDLRLAYRSQSGATGDLIGLLSSAVIDTGATSISTMIQIPSGMAPGMYDLDWRVFAAGTHDLLASLCAYIPGGLEILPGLPGARLALSPPTLSFVGCSVEDSFRDGDVIISNVGTAPLNISGVRLDGDPAPACSGIGVFCLRQAFVPFVVQPGDTTSFGIRFRPNSVGVHEAVLTFDTNDPTGGSRTVTLRGEGTAPGVPVLSIWGDARVKSEPGESTPPVANRKAALYFDVWNSGTAPFVGDLRIDLAVWDLPGVGTTDGYGVSQEAAAGRREVARFLAADNPDLGFSLEAGGKRTMVLRHPAVDGDSASMRFFSSHFSDLLDLTMTTSAGSVTHKYQNLTVAPDPDADAGCLSELASVDRAPDSLDCPIGLYMVAERMVTAAAAGNGSEMGLLLWDMTCSMIECAGQSATWGEVLDACDAAIDTWESESNGNGCGHAVATYGTAIASGLAQAAEAAWVPGSGEGAGAYIVITDPPGLLKVNGRVLLLTSKAVSAASRADSVRVIEVGPGRLIYIPESLLGLTQFSGFGDLSIGLTVDLLSADGVKTSASYPELATGPGTVIGLDLSNPGDPFVLSVDDNGDGTIDRTVESTTQTTVDVMPPSPVRDVNGIVSWTVATLQWTNPPEADFDSLLVRASTSGFPATLTIGRKAFGASGLFPNETLRFSEDLGANGTWFYSFFSVDSAGNASSPETLRVLVNAPLQVEEPAGGGQWPTRIWSVLPNPSRSTMTIRYSVATDRPASIEVFDPLGRRLAHLVDQVARTGFHSVVWDGRDSNGVPVVSGVYLVRLSSGGRADSRRVVLLR